MIDFICTCSKGRKSGLGYALWSTVLGVAFAVSVAVSLAGHTAGRTVMSDTTVCDQEASRDQQEGQAPRSVVRTSRKEFPEIVLQTGHVGSLNSVAFSPDGTKVLTSAYTETILWDAATGVQLRAYDALMTCAAFHPDGTHIATSTFSDKTIILWDVATGQKLRTLEGHDSQVHSLAFSPDGRQLLAGCGEPREKKGEMVLWDLTTTRKLRVFRGYEGHVATIALSPDGRRAVGCDSHGTCILWDVATGQQLHSFARAGTASVFSPDGRFLVTTGDYDGLILWDIENYQAIRKFAADHFSRVVAFSPDGRYVLSGGGASDPKAGVCRVYLFEAGTGAKVRSFDGHRGLVQFVAFSPSGAQVLTGSPDGTVILWHAASGRQLRAFGGHTDLLIPAAISADGRRLLSRTFRYDQPGLCHLWDATTGRLLRVFSGGASQIHAARFTSTGRQVIAALGPISASGSGPNGSMKSDVPFEAVVWDSSTGERLRTIRLTTEPIFFADVSPDGRFVLGAGPDQHKYNPTTSTWSTIPTPAILWDAASGRELHRLNTGQVTHVAFSPDSRKVVTAGGEYKQPGKARVWDVATGSLLQTLPNPSSIVFVTYSPDSSRVLIACGHTEENGEVAVWDLSGTKVRSFAGALAGQFTSDGKGVTIFWISNGHGTATTWDLVKGDKLETIERLSKEEMLWWAHLPGGKRLRARFFTFNQARDWLVLTPEGYFDGSLDARRFVFWRIGDQVCRLEQFEQRFYRPDQVARSLSGQPLSQDDGTRAGVTTDRAPPKVTLELDGCDGASATVRATATTAATGSITTVHFTIDGREIPTESARRIVRQRVNESTTLFRVRFDFPPGTSEVLVAALAIDEIGLKSESATLTVQRPGPAEPVHGTLHLLAVGISRYKFSDYNLEFANRDAEAFVEVMRRQKGRAFADVRVHLLTDDEASVANLRSALGGLHKSCGPGDVAVIFFCGHGVRGNRGNLYYFTHEGDLDALRETCLNWQEISDSLRALAARQVVFLADCCHAGAFAERAASQDELVYGLVKQAGVVVFAASRSAEPSFEAKEWKHGAFTKALLEGLGGNADLIRDGKISLSELQTYVAHRVTALTGDRQHPHIPRLEHFDPQLVIAHVPEGAARASGPSE
jgi:WD40 repeat protein